MKVSIISVFVMINFATIISTKKFVTSEKLEAIRAKAKSWTPYTAENHPFKDLSEEDVKKRFGRMKSKSSLFDLIPKFFLTPKKK